eukprot:TRINITY_DN79676_c0_g1_i1.p1 TRINITY_DN79676_c0_g1~~TRINITY_DN79676_c0_g1_i1.p1  ORF type:complete len:320 (+),score=103.41 TRINITY_DN79676_c0_g1_i1:85-960(+)
MASFHSLLLTCFLACAAGMYTSTPTRMDFLTKAVVNQKLRICNAFPSESNFDVYHNKEMLRKDLTYKSCFESTGELHQGDLINLKVQGLAAGSFTVDELPKTDATLVLVVMKKDTSSMATTFVSHVFASLRKPQVALLDAFKAEDEVQTNVTVESTDEKTAERELEEEPHSPESVSFNSVMAIEPGSYKIRIDGSDGGESIEKRFITESDEAYTAIRVGAQSKTWPQELIIFPEGGKEAPKVKAEKAEKKPQEKASAAESKEEKKEKAAAHSGSHVLPSLFVMTLLAACAQ